MSVLNENTLIGASAAGGYDIPNSLRFNDNDSAYLSRTPASAGNRKTWTWSGWVKRGNLGIDQKILRVPGWLNLNFTTTDTLAIAMGTPRRVTTAKYRDPSSWYHILVALDTSNTTAADRLILYVNSVRIGDFSESNDPSLNEEFVLNSTVAHYLGTQDASSQYLDGYLSEVNFIDGQALTPDSFGETGDYGEWLPKAYAGARGTNGFYLDFKDSGSLGNDAAGSNNWTPTNLAATDQMLDSPTNNFATLNPLSEKGVGQYTFSEGNLELYTGNSYNSYVTSTIGLPLSGKVYIEYECTSSDSKRRDSIGLALNNTTSSYMGQSSTTIGYNGYFGTVTGLVSRTFATFLSGDIIGIAVDCDNGKVWFAKNNVWQEGDPSAGSGQTATLTTPSDWSFALGGYASASSSYIVSGGLNFGQDSSFAGNKTAQGNSDANGIGDFYYATPTGFLALCTKNLPDATVVPSEHFNTVLYTGNGSSTHAITGVGFTPDWLWAKQRNTTRSHRLLDSVRGNGVYLASNNTNSDDSASGLFKTFDSDGFTLDAASALNQSGGTYVAWNWKAGGTGVSNTDGSITSTVSANVDAGFSIVSYTGNGTAGATVGHGLSTAPEMLIVKNRDTGTDGWPVYHSSNTSNPETDYLFLNDTNATADSIFYWNDTSPTSSVFSLGTTGRVNANTENLIAYAFHSVDGYSKVGSYTGNGSDDGTFVYTGFRPAYVMIKRTDSTSNWVSLDSTRDPENATPYKILYPNLSNAEDSSGGFVWEFTSNGIKIRTTSGEINASGGTYIYLAFAESPFKHSNAR